MLFFGRRHAASLAAAGMFLVGSTAASLAVPVALARLTDAIVAPGTGGGTLLTVDRTAVTLGGLLVARAVLGTGQLYLLARVAGALVVDMRMALFHHLTRLGPPFYDSRRVGELVSRLMGDVEQVQSVVTSGLAEGLAYGLTLTGALSIMAWRSPSLTLGALAVVPPAVILGRAYGRRMRVLGSVIQDRNADAAAVVEETLGAIRLVKVFGREAYERDRFARAARGVFRARMNQASVAAVFGPAIGSVAVGALVVVLWLGGRQVAAGALTPGELVAFLTYAGMMGGAISGSLGLYGRWASAIGASRRVFSWLDTEAAVRERPGAVVLSEVVGQVSLQGVEFGYGRGGPVLHGVSLVAEAGETVALVGPSGAGKTTILNLVARFYDPDAGRLTLDGVDLRDVALDTVRGCMAAVPQETVLFNATVEENIRYGRPGATAAQVEAASRGAHAHGFVRALPEGYGTVVGERGIRLSAGERQRIAIARAILRDPRILLLDEATASLDSEGEAQVQAALAALFRSRTTLVVAHRLSTVQGADRIVVIDAGRVVEMGTHDDLVAEGGLYARLHRLQFRSPPANGDDGPGAGKPDSGAPGALRSTGGWV